MKLRAGATVVAACPVLADDFLVTVTDDGCAKATPIAEFEAKGRGGVGVRTTKLADGTALTTARVGPTMGLLAVMASDDDPKKADPTPVPLMLEATGRDLVSTASERQVLVLGPSRW
jgi:DNA gyrase/topoisomerase IV subunit A